MSWFDIFKRPKRAVGKRVRYMNQMYLLSPEQVEQFRLEKEQIKKDSYLQQKPLETQERIALKRVIDKNGLRPQ